jgi:predicted lipoprotein with Yx(FWY)xxD motif
VRLRKVAALSSIAIAVAVAGCGSTGKSSSSKAPPPPASSSSSGGAGTSGSASSSASSAAPEAAITTKRAGKLGTVLAFGSKKLTVYLFEADKGGSASCTGACAKVWPPVTGSPTAHGAAVSADLGTITRPDGTKQVTYKGHPLYLYVKDKDDGDTYGEGSKSFGAGWYVLAPSGNKVDLS